MKTKKTTNNPSNKINQTYSITIKTQNNKYQITIFKTNSNLNPNPNNSHSSWTTKMTTKVKPTLNNKVSFKTNLHINNNRILIKSREGLKKRRMSLIR